jgi:hypothetical protein
MFSQYAVINVILHPFPGTNTARFSKKIKTIVSHYEQSLCVQVPVERRRWVNRRLGIFASPKVASAPTVCRVDQTGSYAHNIKIMKS